MTQTADDNIQYPYWPEADWRIAVSRRFKLAKVDALYAQSVLPVLQKHGVVMECSYAAEDVHDHDFWVNRMNLIFEIADIHVLLDVERNANVDFEFERSRRVTRMANGAAFRSNFGWNPITGTVLFRPFRIIVTEGKGLDTFSKRRREARVYIGNDGHQKDLPERIEAQLLKSKIERHRRLTQALDWWTTKVKFTGTAESEFEVALQLFTQMAYSFRDGETIDDLVPLAEDLEEQSLDVQQLLNERYEWYLKLKRGELEVPPGFWDTYRLLRDYYREGVAEMINEKFANFWLVRLLTSLISIRATQKVRRLRGKGQDDEEEAEEVTEL